MTPRVPENHPLRLFFAGALESAFYSKLGICAPNLVDYLTNLLTDFVHVRDIYSLRSASGDTLRDVCDMVEKAFVGHDLSEESRCLLVHRHVGDYTLYWTGLYPESLGQDMAVRDAFVEYCDWGKESYSIASELSRACDTPPADLLRCLSEHFEDCAQGLTIARHSWDSPEDPDSQIV